MLPAAIVLVYLAIIAIVGGFAYTKSKTTRRGLLPRQPVAGRGRLPALAVQHRRDRVRHTWARAGCRTAWASACTG